MSEKKPIIQQVYAISTPIFTKEMGYRMSMMRENLMLDQAMLAQKLGTTQQTISKLERGIQSTTRAPFSIAKLFDVFGDAILHILLGTGEQRFNYGLIHNKYLTKMYKKRGFGAAKHGIKSELN